MKFARGSISAGLGAATANVDPHDPDSIEAELRFRQQLLCGPGGFKEWLGPLGANRRYFGFIEMAEALDRLWGRISKPTSLEELLLALKTGEFDAQCQPDDDWPVLWEGGPYGAECFSYPRVLAVMRRYPDEMVRERYVDHLYLRADLLRAWCQRHGIPWQNLWRVDAITALPPVEALPTSETPPRAVRRQANGPATSPPARQKRKEDPKELASRKNQIETVIAVARRRWPNPADRPKPHTMAQKLVELEPRKAFHGYGVETIKKILAGQYQPMKRLGVRGL